MRVGLVVPGFSADADDWCIPALRHLARALAAHDDLRVIAIRYPYRASRYVVEGAEVIALGGAERRGAAAPGVWRRTLDVLRGEHRRRPFDVLHAFWATESGLLTAMAGRILGVPTVVSLAGGELVGLPEIGYGDQRVAWERLKVRASLRLASAVTAGSHHLLAIAARQVPHHRLHRAPLGVDLDLFRPALREIVSSAIASPESVSSTTALWGSGSSTPGSSAAGSSEVGSSGTGSSEEGSFGTGASTTGSSATGSSTIGSSTTALSGSDSSTPGSSATGSAAAGRAAAGRAEGGSSAAGSSEVGSSAAGSSAAGSSAAGSSAAGSSAVGSSGTSSSEGGSSATRSSEGGSSGTSSSEGGSSTTRSSEGGSSTTGSSATGSSAARSSEVDSSGTGSSATGSSMTVSSEAGSSGRGSSEGSSSATGSSATGSSGGDSSGTGCSERVSSESARSRRDSSGSGASGSASYGAGSYGTRSSDGAASAEVEARAPRLVHVGTLTPVKDQATLLRAFLLLRRRLDDATLDIVGDGPLRRDLEKLAHELGVAEAVKFHGSVDHAALPAVYGASTAFVLSSRHEAQGMVAIEAAACGIPVVGTCVGVIPELAAAPDAVVPVGADAALADALFATCADPRGRALRVQERIQTEFGLESSVNRFRALYAQVVDA